MKWTLPNTITVGRLAALPAIVWLIWPGVENRETAFWSAVLYAAAAGLDVVDGALARRRNEVTVMGKFLDPLADKLFHLVTLVALLQLPGPRVPMWVVLVILTRELAITGLRGIAVSEGIVIAAGSGGKAKTSLASVGMVALLIHYPYYVNFGFAHATIHPHEIGVWVTYVSVLFSVTSAATYMHGFVQAMRQGGARTV